MKVALISPYAFSVPGGVQEQVLGMSRELSARGHDVIICAPDNRDSHSLDTPARVFRRGRLLRLPANGSYAPLSLSPAAASAVWRDVSEFGPDVVHFHEPFAPLIGWRVLVAHRYPSVVTFHRSGGGPAVSLTAPLLKFLARRVDGATAVSDFADATMGRASGLSCKVLFNGFETERFREFPREQSSRRRAVIVGRLESRKGVATALRAWRLVPNDWELVIVGDGPERAALQREFGNLSSVTWRGVVNDEEKRRLLRSADLLIAPALFGESFGLVLLEAMAAETPVFASDIDGYRQAAGGCATLFAPGDERALATALTTFVRRESDVAAARAHAEQWSMSALVDHYDAIYADARERFRRRG